MGTVRFSARTLAGLKVSSNSRYIIVKESVIRAICVLCIRIFN